MSRGAYPSFLYAVQVEQTDRHFFNVFFFFLTRRVREEEEEREIERENSKHCGVYFLICGTNAINNVL